MRIYADRIQIERAEAWTYDVLFQNRDGSPFIISNQLDNPYIVVTVASSRYDQQNRYIANFWCDVKKRYPTFYCTQPIQIEAVDGVVEVPLKALSDDIRTDIFNKDQTYGTYCVYSCEIEGTMRYYQWVPNDSDGISGQNGSYVEYTFPFDQLFTSEITKTWVERNYVFGVKLTAGTANEGYDDSDVTARPLVTEDSVMVLVPPTQLVVTNNITGSII